jgi:hypothetical protein
MTEADQRQVDMIQAYLADLWCPERPRWCYEGPAERVCIDIKHPRDRWIRQLDYDALRVRSYADVLEMIRAA